jgi:hypothetical protein
MASEGRQVVLRTLRSIARASGRVSIVIMILLMLVDPKRKLFVAELFNLTRQNDVRATKKIELMLVHCDRVESLAQKIFEFDNFALLRLQVFLMLNESFK